MKENPSLLSIIKKSILLYLLFGVVLSILIMSPFQFFSFLRFHQEKQRELTTSISISILQYLDNADNAMVYLADVDFEHIGEHLETFIAHYRYFDRLILADSYGKINYSVPESSTFPDISNMISDINPSLLFSSYFSFPFISPDTGKLTINTILPIHHGQGYLIGELNLDFLQEQIFKTAEQTVGSLIFVTDQYGNMLIHPEKRLVEEQANWGYMPLLKAIRVGQDSREGMYLIQDKRYQASGLFIPGVKWILIDAIETEKLVKDMVRPILIMILIFCILFFGLLFIIAQALTRNMVNPLTYMFQILEKSVEEEVLQPIEKIGNSFSELETVRQTFNVLISKIRQNTEKLEQFERAVEVAGYAIYITDKEGSIIYVNPAFERITGYAEQEVLGKNSRILSSGIMPDAYFTRLWDTILTGELWDEQIINRRKDGAVYYANQTIATLADEMGNVSSFVAIQNDVTLQREAERRLKESESLYRNLFENAADSILLLSTDSFEITECNQAAWQNLGYSREEMRQLSLLDIQDSDTWPVVMKEIALLEEENQVNFDSRHKTKTGEVREVSINLTRLDFGLRPLLLAMIHDMTERKQNEEAIRQSEKRYRLLAENSTDMISRHTPEGDYLYASPACERLLGYTQQELIGRNAFELFHPEDLEAISISHEKLQHIEKDDVASVTYRIQKKDGSWIWFETLSKTVYIEDASDIEDGKNTFQEIMAVSRDVSERVKMSQALAMAKDEAEEANRAKSSFLANMSHEIRTPLNAVLGYNELINRNIRDKELKEYSDQIEKSGRILLMLIGDILDISRIEAGRLELSYEPFDPRQLSSDIESMFSLEAQRRGLEFIVDIEETVPQTIVLDESRLRQVLINLLGNALKFTESGSVTLSVRTDLDTPERGLCTISLIVQDTGIGIPFSQQEKIFEAFLQTEGQNTRKYGGTGLGLAISKNLTEAMGGNIAVYSENGKGTAFTIIFQHVKYLKGPGNQRKTSKEKQSIPKSQAISPDIEYEKSDTLMNLSEEWKKRLEKVRSSMILDDIEDFALALKKEGKLFKDGEIDRFASYLLQAVEELDFERLRKLLDSYLL
jgi:PAS domain S-box-containing protein